MSDRIVETITAKRYFYSGGSEHNIDAYRQTICVLGAITGTYTLSNVPELDYEVVSGGVTSSHSIYSYKDGRIGLSLVVTTGDYGLPYSGGAQEIRWRLYVFLTNIRVVGQIISVWQDTLQPVEPLRTWTAAEFLSEGAGQFQGDPIITQVAAVSVSQTCARDTWDRYGQWSGTGHPLSAERFLGYPGIQQYLPSVGITGQSSRVTQSDGYDLMVWNYFSPQFPIEVTGAYQKPGYYGSYNDLQLLYYDDMGRVRGRFTTPSRTDVITGQTSDTTIPFNLTIEAIRLAYDSSTKELPL
jgi:hypothetical protein